MIKRWVRRVCVGLLVANTGCSSDGDGSEPAATGGTPGAGGTASGGTPATGGTMASGGTPASGGTATSGGSGGTPAAGAGGSGGGSAGTVGSDVPEDRSQAGIEAFLKTDVFASWTWDSETPRAAGAVSPHGRVRVGINDTLAAAIAAGADGSTAEKAFPAGSMALKEMYDDTNFRIGRALMLKHGAANSSPNWLYYCDGSDAARCGVSGGATVPFYATGNAFSACNTCHGSYFFIGTK